MFSCKLYKHESQRDCVEQQALGWEARLREGVRQADPQQRKWEPVYALSLKETSKGAQWVPLGISYTQMLSSPKQKITGQASARVCWGLVGCENTQQCQGPCEAQTQSRSHCNQPTLNTAAQPTAASRVRTELCWGPLTYHFSGQDNSERPTKDYRPLIADQSGLWKDGGAKALMEGLIPLSSTAMHDQAPNYNLSQPDP